MAWEELSAIYHEAGELYQEEKATPPVACPNDGEPLQENSRGELCCPFDGWKWRG